MDLPKNNSRLSMIFKGARTPDLDEFHGEYSVDMLTVIPSFKRFSHRKVFYSEGGAVTGHNLLLNREWGHFFVEKGKSGGTDPFDVIVINYNRSENFFLTRRVRDHVRCIEKGRLYLGRFNYLFMERLFFLGYFSLKR
jgi:hypothetical protein